MNAVFIVVYKYIRRVYFKNGDSLIELENFSAYQYTWEPKAHIPRLIVEEYELGVVSLSSDAIGNMHISAQFLSASQQRLSEGRGEHFYF